MRVPKRRTSLPPLCVVWWYDAYDESGYSSKSQFVDVLPVFTAGFLIEETPSAILLAAALDDDISDETEGRVRDLRSITKVNIQRMKTFSLLGFLQQVRLDTERTAREI